MINQQSNTLGRLAWTMILGATGLLSACAGASSGAPLDVGSMALPTSTQQAATITSSVSRPSTPDIGNMAFPAPLPQGVISRTANPVRYPDTGNMALPTARPTGDLAITPQ